MGLTGGKPVSLTVGKGHALVLAEGHFCKGTARGSDPMTLTLACDGGYTARTEGSARAEGEARAEGSARAGEAKLVVTWSGGAKDTLTAADAP
ncbi:hypothetical protein EF905_23520 [Streptomyces sp. WAC05374]|nr:hypothetical protein EF905_23520 [Streptomyces sp. WAC05374]